jgi:GTP-binding protein LepA
MAMEHIRNFVIIAHIDSGKSTLADRLLEVTSTVEARAMRPQYLDQLDLERERGITIKMAPVRMKYHPQQRAKGKEQRVDSTHLPFAICHLPDSEFILNLIDTPGHSDFGYEVSRALAAVEGAILLVDGTKGIQAQTLANLRAARRAGLTIVGAVNKIDVRPAHIEKIIEATAELLGEDPARILRISAKTGTGIEELLETVVARVPPPRRTWNGEGVAARIGVVGRQTAPKDDTGGETENRGLGIARALIFDSLYDDHKGIVAFVRLFGGSIRAGDEVVLAATEARVRVKEVGFFTPKFAPCEVLSGGEIGYVATGLKEPALVKIGDTVIAKSKSQIANRGEGNDSRFASGDMRRYALPGYKEPQPVVFISFYPDGDTKFEDLERALARLKLNDAALSFEPESNEALGRGFKVGFLGQLHFEIAASRLTREFRLSFLTSFPSVAYRVEARGASHTITQPQDFPENPDKVWEPMIALEIVVPPEYLHQVLALQQTFELQIGDIHNFGVHLALEARMPLRELIRDFDDRLKSASAGFASFSYELSGEVAGEMEKLEILLAGDVVPALTRVVPKSSVAHEARQTVERLKDVLPRQQFMQAIQARAEGRIIARETIPAMKKLLGNFGKTGGDRTRKMKLWKKQQEGKKKLLAHARVKLSPEVFREILKK